MSALPAHNTAPSSLPLVIWFPCLAGQVRGSNEIIQNAFGLSLSCCHLWDGFFSVNPVVKGCQSPLQISLIFHNDFKKISTNNKIGSFFIWCICMVVWLFFEVRYLYPENAKHFCITFVQCWNNIEDVGPTLYKCYTNVCVYWKPVYLSPNSQSDNIIRCHHLDNKKRATCKACGFTSQWK